MNTTTGLPEHVVLPSGQEPMCPPGPTPGDPNPPVLGVRRLLPAVPDVDAGSGHIGFAIIEFDSHQVAVDGEEKSAFPLVAEGNATTVAIAGTGYFHTGCLDGSGPSPERGACARL